MEFITIILIIGALSFSIKRVMEHISLAKLKKEFTADLKNTKNAIDNFWYEYQNRLNNHDSTSAEKLINGLASTVVLHKDTLYVQMVSASAPNETLKKAWQQAIEKAIERAITT